MKVAFAIWNGRIAPVFDTAGEVLVADFSEGRISGEFTERLPVKGSVLERSERLKATGAELLICGAVSRFVKTQIELQGIKVFSFVSGEIRDVMNAWQNNEIERDIYAMPGCRRRCRGGWRNEGFVKNTGGGRRGRFGPKHRGV
ncbi:MAG: NifB/NifX family molybdenum-iron cluster-binding protein [Kiritimatiellia bacterium]